MVSSGFPNKMYAFLPCVCTVCPAYLKPLGFITLRILADEYKL